VRAYSKFLFDQKILYLKTYDTPQDTCTGGALEIEKKSDEIFWLSMVNTNLECKFSRYFLSNEKKVGQDKIDDRSVKLLRRF